MFLLIIVYLTYDLNQIDICLMTSYFIFFACYTCIYSSFACFFHKYKYKYSSHIYFGVYKLQLDTIFFVCLVIGGHFRLCCKYCFLFSFLLLQHEIFTINCCTIYNNFLFVFFINITVKSCLGGIMIGILDLILVDYGFNLWSSQTNDYKLLVFVASVVGMQHL